MDLLPDEEQAEIAQVGAAFLDARLPAGRLLELDGRPEPIDRAVWAAIAELGWFGLGVAEADGGVGYSLAEEALLFHEIGSRLGPTPLLATVLAVRAAVEAGDKALRDRLLGGEMIAAMASTGGSATHQLFDGDEGELVLTFDPERVALYDVEAIGDRAQRPCLDESVSLADVDLGGVVPRVEVDPAAVLSHAVVLSAAMLAGIASTARDDGTGYANEREQFGKPIGTFQAIKHYCADMAIRCEMATTQVLYAALTVSAGLDDGAYQAAAAKAVATDAARRNADADLQIHGGYGYTTEYLPHLLVKRVHVLDRFCGAERDHLASLVSA